MLVQTDCILVFIIYFSIYQHTISLFLLKKCNQYVWERSQQNGMTTSTQHFSVSASDFLLQFGLSSNLPNTSSKDYLKVLTTACTFSGQALQIKRQVISLHSFPCLWAAAAAAAAVALCFLRPSDWFRWETESRLSITVQIKSYRLTHGWVSICNTHIVQD